VVLANRAEIEDSDSLSWASRTKARISACFNASEFVSALLKSDVDGRPLLIRFDQVHKRYANGREALTGVSSPSTMARWLF